MGKRKRVKRAALPPPDPIFVPSTTEYLGNDGQWSTHALRVGTPSRLYKVLASTSSPETWLVGPEGCTDQDPKDCPDDRGLLYNSSASSTWQNWANRTKYTLDDNRQLPMGGVGFYGTDNVSIISNRNEPESVQIPDHNIARISTKDYFLGMFGLSIRPLAPEKQVGSRTSNLVDMKRRGIIPSLAYGFTAGAKYRRQGQNSKLAHTQLILGGYDSKAFTPNDVDFKMGPIDSGRELTLSVKSIAFSTNSTAITPILGKSFSAVIDSSVSHYWLPPEVCDSFARVFDLTFNETTGLYLVNDTQHNQLVTMNPTISFTLASEGESNSEVTIQLPYLAFELRITSEWPQGPRWSRYFPIRPAINPSQYTLGRAFLQESYLITNYESKNFSISQRTYIADKPNIVAIRDQTRPIVDEVSNVATYGLIAGGCALAGLLILFLVYRCARKREKHADSQGDSTDGKTELDSTANRTIFELGKGHEAVELDGKPRVEAANPEIKCAYDHHQEMVAAQGPFELPADEVFASSSSAPLRSASIPPSPSTDDDEQISPVDGSPASNFTGHSWNHTISPITPSDSTSRMMRREPSVPSLPAIQEKHKSTENP